MEELFGRGYDRVALTREHVKREYKPEAVPMIKNVETAIGSRVDDSVKPYEATKTLEIAPIHDRQNRLTTLIANAKQNEAALAERNAKRAESRDRQKAQYGW